jgi:hypothetical protein
MRRDVRILFVTALFGGAVSAAERLPGLLERMDVFQISDIEVLGLRYMDREDLVRTMAVLPGSSVWTDTEIWEDRLAMHPMVKTVLIERRIPDRLRISVTERQPVALAPTPTLEPVDIEGFRLPLDPSEHRLDLPVLATTATPARGASMFPAEVRGLAAEVGRLMGADTVFAQRVSEVGWAPDGAVTLTWTEPRVTFVLHVGTSSSRLMEGQAALADAAVRAPGAMPNEVDLRFADQVVIRRTREW